MAGSLVTRSILAALAAVSSGVTTVSVHAAARALGPVTADCVAERGTTRPIDSGDTSRLGADDARGLTKNRLARAGDRRRASVGGSRGRGLASCGSIFAAILTAIGNETVTIGGATIAVRRAASSVCTVGVASGSAEVASTSAIISGGGSTSLWLGSSCRCNNRRLSTVAASRLTSVAAVCWAAAAPAVLTAAGSLVDGRVGVAQKIAVGGSTLSVLGVLCVLPLLGETDRRTGPGSDLGVVSALGVGSAGIPLCAVLAS